MTRIVQSKCSDLTIPLGSNVSNILLADIEFADAIALTLYGKAGIPADDLTVEVSNDAAATATSDWYTLSNSTNNITPPLAGTATVYPFVSFRAMRLKDNTGVAAADMTWKVTKAYYT